jgi:hypothetical protein
MSSPALPRRRTLPRATIHPRASSEAIPSPLAFPAPAADGHPEPVAGRYRCDEHGDAWWWSAEMYLLHGLQPGTAEPCIQLLLDGLLPADRHRTAQGLAAACAGTPFSLAVRAVRPGREPRTMVLVGEPQTDGSGTVTGIDGLYVDVADGLRPTEVDRVTELETEVAQLRTAMASRAAIEQAKGILMLLTSCGDQVAFDLLAHISSHTHRKVREVAVAITESAAGHGTLPDDIRSILHDACPPTQAI